MGKVKLILGLERTNVTRLDGLEQDILGLQEVWLELKNLWVLVDEIRCLTLNSA